MSKKSPQLRFEGFTDDWEERKFGEVWKKSSERNLNLEYSPKQVLSVAQMKLNPSNRNEQDDYMKTYNVLHKGDIAFEGNKSKSFAFGRFVLNDLQDGIVSHVFNVYRPICKMDTDFMKVYINNESVMKYLLVKATTKTLMMTTLNTKDIVKQKLNLPSLEEQQKIGSFFKQLDKTIALHQRKLDLLKEQKKGYLQKMFPKNGEKVPELRFAGFADDWEQRRLKEITERVRGNDGRMDLPTLTISAGSGWLDQRERFSGNIAGKEQKNYTLLKKGQLSYNHGNSKLAKYGAVFELKTYNEALVPRVYHSFGTNELSNPNFIEYMFVTKRPDKELAKLVSSGARMDGLLNINFDEFMGINVNIPSVGEQKKIGSFFKQLDDTIALHQRKLDLLKEQKKGFLQKMFV